jgi:hypothetical protein
MSLLPFPQFNGQLEKILAILWARELLLNGTRFKAQWEQIVTSMN